MWENKRNLWNENCRKSKSFKLLPGICLIPTLLCLIHHCAPAYISTRIKHLSPRPIKSFPSSIENHNFQARYLNGNIRRNGIKLSHWNQGPGFLSTKRNEIENIINGYTPHILGISEGSFHSSHDITEVQIENYDVYFSKALQNPQLNVSRLAVYVHKDLNVKVRTDLMNDTFNSVWLECGLPRQKKF